MGSGYYDQLIKILKQYGCTFLRQGKGSHEIWNSPITQKPFPVAYTITNRHTANNLGFVGFCFCAEGGIFNFFKETDMKKPKHTNCISNFLLGFGSILNIAPVVSVSSTIEIEPNEYKYFNNAWEETGRHLRDALNKRVWGKYGN